MQPHISTFALQATTCYGPSACVCQKCVDRNGCADLKRKKEQLATVTEKKNAAAVSLDKTRQELEQLQVQAEKDSKEAQSQLETAETDKRLASEALFKVRS